MSSLCNTKTQPAHHPVARERCIEGFRQHYGREPEWLVEAPGRINLIGEHVDYNDGWVLPAAIDRHLCLAASSLDSPVVRLHSEQQDLPVDFSLDEPWAPSRSWTDYLIGVLKAFMDRGAHGSGLALSVASDIPLGAGLSSSAALELAVATLAEKTWSYPLEPMDKALLCQKVEAEFVGMPCGIMDQAIVALAKANHFLLLDCQRLTWRHVPAAPSFPSLLILDTQVSHALVDGAYARRREQCDASLRALNQSSWRDVGTLSESEIMALPHPSRARHVLSEMQRTLEAVECLQNGSWHRLGQLLYASHVSLRDDFQVSCSELDWLVDALQNLGHARGVWGARMTGGGFGGCVVALVEPESVDPIMPQLSQDYTARFGHDFSWFVSQPAQACRVIPYRNG